jgi:hypothetical protein
MLGTPVKHFAATISFDSVNNLLRWVQLLMLCYVIDEETDTQRY